jgi:hypothetical protein
MLEFRDWQSIRTPLEPLFAHAGIMMTRLQRYSRDFGIVHVSPCVKGRSVIACFFSLLRMILLVKISIFH